MLGFGRLFKHEFSAVGRVMLPLYGAVIASSIIFGLSNLIGADNGGGILTVTTALLYGLTVMAVIAFTAVILIQRYYKNLLGNEGYLNFTMPVSINAHIGNKTLSAGLWMFFAAVVGMLSVFIIMQFMVTPAEIAQEAGAIWDEISAATPSAAAKLALLIIEVLAIMIVGGSEIAIKIYAAISLGQLWSNHRVLGAVGAYIGLSIAESILGGVMEQIIPLSGPSSLMNGLSDFAQSQVMMLVILAVQLAMIAIYWVVNNRLLTKKLNLQ